MKPKLAGEKADNGHIEAAQLAVSEESVKLAVAARIKLQFIPLGGKDGRQ